MSRLLPVLIVALAGVAAMAALAVVQRLPDRRGRLVLELLRRVPAPPRRVPAWRFVAINLLAPDNAIWIVVAVVAAPLGTFLVTRVGQLALRGVPLALLAMGAACIATLPTAVMVLSWRITRLGAALGSGELATARVESVRFRPSLDGGAPMALGHYVIDSQAAGPRRFKIRWVEPGGIAVGDEIDVLLAGNRVALDVPRSPAPFR
jgi:hypothetical protein